MAEGGAREDGVGEAASGAELVLASTSRWRRAQLARLGLPFEVCAPDFAELREGRPEEVVRGNALGKARSVFRRMRAQGRRARVIGSDQIAAFDGGIVGKPGSLPAAMAQLRRFSGRQVSFLTGVALVDDGGERYALDRTIVHFRTLTEAQIARYVRCERPLSCAGGFRVEGLGIALFSRIESEDPSALIGLPLIPLAGWLQPLDASVCAPQRETGS